LCGFNGRPRVAGLLPAASSREVPFRSLRGHSLPARRSKGSPPAETSSHTPNYVAESRIRFDASESLAVFCVFGDPSGSILLRKRNFSKLNDFGSPFELRALISRCGMKVSIQNARQLMKELTKRSEKFVLPTFIVRCRSGKLAHDHHLLNSVRGPKWQAAQTG
jgi:hypothetical protein